MSRSYILSNYSKNLSLIEFESPKVIRGKYLTTEAKPYDISC